jgi:hypothetical protein
MSTCGGRVNGVSGTGQARRANRAFLAAIGNLLVNGKSQCIGKSCDSGTCTFGLTELTAISEPMDVGNEVRFTVTGNGGCYCE